MGFVGRLPFTQAERAEYLTAPWLSLAGLCLALLWLFTGLTSLWWGWPQGMALLQQAQVPAALAPWLIAAGGCWDLLLGAAQLRPRRWVYALQLTTILLYMLVASYILPSLWLDPLGAITKNLPILILTAILWLRLPSGR